MSRPADRIPVPSNGHGPPLEAAPPSVDGPASADDDAAAGTAGTAGPDLRFAFTPARAAVGFSVIASLILLAVGRRRRRG